VVAGEHSPRPLSRFPPAVDDSSLFGSVGRKSSEVMTLEKEPGNLNSSAIFVQNMPRHRVGKRGS